MFDDIPKAIRWIAHYLRGLTAANGQSWVPLSQLSRRVAGSEEYLPNIQASVELPEFADLFVIHGGVIKLTAAGLQFVMAEGPPATNDGASIGRTVRDYAAGLGYDVILATKVVARIPAAHGKTVHAFEIENIDQILSSDTPVRHRSKGGGANVFGKIVALDSEARLVYVACPTQIFDDELPGILQVDRGYLLSQLAERLEALTAIPVLASPLFQSHVDQPALFDANSVELGGQLAAIERPWTRLFWGPPGSGKTFALGYLVGRVLQENPTSRVLIVAPSNKAVDVASSRSRGTWREKVHSLFRSDICFASVTHATKAFSSGVNGSVPQTRMLWSSKCDSVRRSCRSWSNSTTIGLKTWPSLAQNSSRARKP